MAKDEPLERALTWQQANIQAAAAYLRERMKDAAPDARTRAVYEGLLDVLEPARRSTRVQRESAEAAKAAVAITAERDRRRRLQRRGHSDRRLVDLGAQNGVERRTSRDRRDGRDRRRG